MFLADIGYCSPKDAAEIFALEELSSVSPWPLSLIRRDLAGETAMIYLGARGKDLLLGFAALGPCRRGAELARIAVRPDYRRRGIGSQLLVGASEVALSLGYTRLSLHVRASQSGARAFYERNAFLPLAPAPGYYEGGEDALLMESSLPLVIVADAL
ncbi:MAG: GNAT family N-acetyltransferase [Synergistaceae bacterium]|nr:GNAT family N-acetyltransferase [Synergistota bacterium]NLM72000.1 GNAT family N-acetyltransferase [Synergistaceae bacterium]